MSNKLIRNGFSVIEMIYRVICKANPGFERKTEFIRNGTHNEVIYYKHVFTEPTPMPESELPEL